MIKQFDNVKMEKTLKHIDKSKYYMLILTTEFLMHEVECFGRFLCTLAKRFHAFGLCL